MAQIIDGKATAKKIREEMKEEIIRLQDDGIVPGLAVVLVGEDPASKVYVNNKQKACQEVGIYSELYRLPEETSQKELLELIDELNGRADIDGILVQLPLPKQIDEEAVLLAIDPHKDVDCFHPINVGKVWLGEETFLPCTPCGVLRLLQEANVEMAGKYCVIVGRSNIVGKPMAAIMLNQNATVTVCHSKTENLAEICRQADILISAVGKPGYITGDMVKEGAAVIDVGTTRGEDGKLHGDVNFAEVEPKAGCISPVPGGVGPMTITMLLQNAIFSAKHWTK